MIYYWNTEKRKSFLHLASFLTVREVAVPGEPTGGEGFAWIWMFWALQKKKKKKKTQNRPLFIYLFKGCSNRPVQNRNQAIFSIIGLNWSGRVSSLAADYSVHTFRVGKTGEEAHTYWS